MERDDIDDVEPEEDDLNFNSHRRRFGGDQSDEPMRSPISIKDKWRQEEGIKARAKRSHKKIQRRLKYDWQGE